MENQNTENEKIVEIEDISNDEFKRKFLEKYKKYKLGILTEKDFVGYEAFMLEKMTRRRTKNGRRKIFEKIYVRLIKFEILL
jgi:hypothetical protein